MKRLIILITLALFLSSCESDLIDCGDNPDVGGICVDITKPEITGVEDSIFLLGTEFSLFEGITASDDLDGDLTSEIQIEESIKPTETGEYLVKYRVSDSSGNETLKLRYITIYKERVFSNNMVTNGDFSDGLNGWTNYTVTNEGDADFDVIDEELKITIKSINDGLWYVPRLDYQGLNFEKGKEYIVSFKAKAESSRQLHIQIGELIDQEPWFVDFRPNTDKLFLLTETYQDFEFTFTMNNETNNNGAILFEMGDIPGFNNITTIYLDDVVIQAANVATVLEKIEAESFINMQGIQTEQTSDAGGGLNVGYLDADDFIEYSLEVPEAGTYRVDMRVASAIEGGRFDLKYNNQYLVSATIANTGGWQEWITIETETFDLPAGVYVFRIDVLQGGFNINYFEFKKVN